MLPTKVFAVFAIIGAATLPAWTTAAQAADGTVKKPKAIRYCVACHTFKKGEGNKIGPNLYGTYGTKAASNPGFAKYGESMKAAGAAGLIWDDANLDAYIENPIKFLKAKTGQNKVKTSMITKVRKAKDRKAIIEYLKALKD